MRNIGIAPGAPWQKWFKHLSVFAITGMEPSSFCIPIQCCSVYYMIVISSVFSKSSGTIRQDCIICIKTPIVPWAAPIYFYPYLRYLGNLTAMILICFWVPGSVYVSRVWLVRVFATSFIVSVNSYCTSSSLNFKSIKSVFDSTSWSIRPLILPLVFPNST